MDNIKKIKNPEVGKWIAMFIGTASLIALMANLFVVKDSDVVLPVAMLLNLIVMLTMVNNFRQAEITNYLIDKIEKLESKSTDEE